VLSKKNPSYPEAIFSIQYMSAVQKQLFFSILDGCATTTPYLSSDDDATLCSSSDDDETSSKLLEVISAN
jgi:hypothetical protein